MGPKKNVISASTPAVNKAGIFPSTADSSGPSSIESSLVVRHEVSEDLLLTTKIVPRQKFTTLELAYKAIEVVGVPRKGASYVAMLKWITNNNENVVIGRLKANLRKAVLKALEDGNLKRASVSKNAKGLHGYFILNKDKQIKSKTTTKKTVAKKEKKEPDTEVTKKLKKRDDGRLNNSPTEDVSRRKVLFKSKTKILGAIASLKSQKEENELAPKKMPAAISKKKTAVVPKTKTAVVPKTKTVVVPKTKNVPAQKAKLVVFSFSESESEIASTSEDEFENAATSKPKVVKISKLKAKAPILKSKTKAVEIMGEKLVAEKSKKVKPTKTKEIVDSLDLEEPEMMGEKLVAEKSKKRVKPTKTINIVDSLKLVEPKPTKNNIPRTRKLYSCRVNPRTNVSREDYSDTELTVKPVNRKSLKSYSSDTEVDVVKKEKAIKAARGKLKTANIKKPATEVGEAGPSKPKAIKKQKAKNAV